MNEPILDRRNLLARAAGFGLSVNLLASAAFAASESALAKRKLIVIVCRGAMDGLSVMPPVGDANYAALRGPIAVDGFGTANGALRLDSTFGLHPSLVSTYKLAQTGRARIAPAVATQDRSRSHFQAQDVLEAGAETRFSPSGWLNRALVAMAASRKVTALSIGSEMPLILRGKYQITTWAPGALDNESDRITQVLSDLYADDPILGPALAGGLQAQAIAEKSGVTDVQRPSGRRRAARMEGGGNHQYSASAHQRDIARELGKAVAALMASENGPSIAALSLTGFDTHARQKERIADRLAYIDGTIDGIAGGLGLKWNDTLLVAVTEFGRTAHVNGNDGTDHGTASAAILAGGALRPGGIVGDWPTLAQTKLYENRDVAPATDMRSLLKGILADQLALDRGPLDRDIFPDSAAAAPVKNLIA